MQMDMDMVKRYMTSSIKMPYFLFVSDDRYETVRNELPILGFDFVPMSSFCSSDDKLPDDDGLFNYIKTTDVNADKKNFVVTGLGEFLALCGTDKAVSYIFRLKHLDIGDAKVVLLLRGLASLIARLQREDVRFDDSRYCVVDKAECNLSFTNVAPSIGLSALSGFKAMLAKLENGQYGSIVVSTIVPLDKAIFTVRHINSAYDGIKFSTNGFAIDRSCGTDTYWAELLTEISRSNDSLDAVFEKYDFGNNLDLNFYACIVGDGYRNWLYFIYLKNKVGTLQNGYLQFVLNQTSRFNDFVEIVLNAIIDISHTDKRFSSFYRERKVLVEKFPEPDIAGFVVKNRLDVSESVYKLTDNTRTEREEIIAWVSKNGMIPQINDIYPMLAAYLKKYVFKCQELADVFTEYFEDYKRQKLSNKIEPEFLKKVDDFAISRKFNWLPTRNVVMDGVDKNGAFLYWLDALGVEYLSLIEALVQKRGLSVRVSITQANLPTITINNKDFFDKWQGRKKKNEDLDITKHKDKGGYNYETNDLPIHLARELEIISNMIDEAATELASRKCTKVLIVSDHGASRLAVLHRKEEKYDTDTKGEQSGRCCKLFQPYELPFAAEEDGYLVLADYGRFKGSRAANVEVHGGASLEEVVVPIIELSLKDRNVTVKLIDKTVIVDSQTGVKINLFFNSPIQEDVSVVLNGKPYQALQTDDAQHFAVILSDTKRAGNYQADVFVGDNLIGNITIKAQGKGVKVNDSFNDLF